MRMYSGKWASKKINDHAHGYHQAIKDCILDLVNYDGVHQRKEDLAFDMHEAQYHLDQYKQQYAVLMEAMSR